MDYKVVYKKSVQRDLKKLSKNEKIRILEHIENELIRQPEAYPVLKSQFAGLRKYRVGNYRVIYTLSGNELLILRIGDRKSVYKGNMLSDYLRKTS